MDASDITIGARMAPIKVETGKAIASPQTDVGNPAKTATPADVEVQRQTTTRSELDVDRTVERVVSRVVDTSGSVVDQIPTEEELRLLERSRQIIGAFLNKTA